jgi:Rne/Rng family ribonuclease
MPKELFIASSPHETKVAVIEDDSLVEVFYQRDTDVGLVGGIYKGRVSRVLPGMQSAFVDIGLERDAFLYVSDFFEDSDEYDRVVADAETRVNKFTAAEAQPAAAAPSEAVEPLGGGQSGVEAGEQPGVDAASEAPAGDTEAPAAATPEPPAGTSSPQETRNPRSPDRPWQDSPGGRGRRRRRGRGRFGRQPFRERESERRPAPPHTSSTGFEVLPGESLAKYGQGHMESEAPSNRSGLETESASLDSQRSEEEFRAPEIAVQSEDLPREDEAADISVQAVVQESSRPAFPESGEAVEKPEDTAPSEAENLEDDLLAGNFRIAPLSVEPDAPAHRSALASAGSDVARGAGSGAATSSAGPAPDGAQEPETLASEGTDGPDSLAGEIAAEADEVEADAGASEVDGEADADEAAGSSFEEALQELPEDTSQAAEAGQNGGGAEEQQAGSGPEAPDGRSYTIRDQHQRPRFAPRRGRRGRGRFGNRGPRQEGHGRRPDFPRSGNEQPVQINEVLKEGQEILVQIAKEPLGTKGARITSHIALPGRYLVYMPTIHHIGVSRKISTEEERLRLRNIILEHRGSLMGGIIVRTAAAGRSEEELKGDLGFLAKLWHEIRTRTERTKAPALIHRDLTLVERILRDILSPDFKSIRVDNELEYQNVLDFVHRFQPSLVGHVKLYSRDNPLFEEFGIQSEIDKALKPKVWLKSGGYIVINQTEALVAIDVNTGKYVGKTNRLEDTIVKTNIDAVKEIVRQVRLRDLGGIVVIDFIDMDDRRNRAKVVQALEEALRKDRAPTKILSFNEFGLVALTRKRVKQSLERTLSEQCPYCTGSGWIKSVTTVCYEIMEEAKKMAGEIEGKTLTLRVNPEVARALKSREGVLTGELESLTGKDVVIKSDPTVHQERFEIF